MQLMGIVNVTPDSFSDGGRYLARDRAVAHALALLDDGATWIDVGGESTRPGADPVSAEVEASRVVPVIQGILDARPDSLVSVDTSKAAVAAAALLQGAAMVNDVTAGSDPAMFGLVAEAGCLLCLMHMRGTPRTMQADTVYDDLVDEVVAALRARRDAAVAAGVDPARIWLDPGLGFGKAPADNPSLLAGTPRLAALGHPVLIGASRKRFIGTLTGVIAAEERVHGSVGAALAAASLGAHCARVHDVRATAEALAVFEACRES